jgi:hypothetical protein
MIVLGTRRGERERERMRAGGRRGHTGPSGADRPDLRFPRLPPAAACLGLVVTSPRRGDSRGPALLPSSTSPGGSSPPRDRARRAPGRAADAASALRGTRRGAGRDPPGSSPQELRSARRLPEDARRATRKNRPKRARARNAPRFGKRPALLLSRSTVPRLLSSETATAAALPWLADHHRRSVHCILTLQSVRVQIARLPMALGFPPELGGAFWHRTPYATVASRIRACPDRGSTPPGPPPGPPPGLPPSAGRPSQPARLPPPLSVLFNVINEPM